MQSDAAVASGTKNVLLATTGRDNCLKAEEYALSYCAENAATLGIVHVVESDLSHYGQVDSLATEGDRSDFIIHARRQEEYDVRQRLERVTARAEALNVDYELYIEWDAPLYCITKHVRETRSELLVIGGEKKRFNPFSLSHCLTRKVPCQVRKIF